MRVATSNSLSGVNVLVTRPQHQCTVLANRIREEGGNAVLFPVLTITDVDNTDKLVNLVKRLHEFDWAFLLVPMPFIKPCNSSPNMVIFLRILTWL